MENETVGMILKNKRLQNQWDLEEVSRRTCIRRDYLEAIENESSQRIGDPVYIKGFIRNYGEALGLQGDALVRQWNRQQGESRLPQVSRARGGEAAIQEDQGRSARSPAKRPFTKVEWAIILVVAALIVLFWVWMLYL